MQLTDATLAYGREVATALLGVDAKYRQESGDEDGLVVLNLDERGEFTPESLPSYADCRARMLELRARAAQLAEPDRRAYYDDLCHSTLAFITWRERDLSFPWQLSEFLRVPSAPAPERDLDDLRHKLKSALDKAGYRGTLEQQCAAWEASQRVTPDDVGPVLARFLDEAWDRTNHELLPIPAEKADGMKVTPVSAVPFNARCDYLHRSIELNTDPILTRAGLRHLAVHEGYPGHYYQFKLRQTWYQSGEAAADVLLSVVNTASSSVFEGIADVGLEMLGWSRRDDDRIQALLTRYRAGIGTGAAWRLHALGWTTGQVADWLHGMTLVGGRGWVDNRMAFIKAPARAVLIWTYWWGEPSVAQAWQAVAPEARPEFLRFLHGRMHSLKSLAMFDQAAA